MGIFPAQEPAQTALWINRPGSGRLSGLISADGRAFWPGTPGLSRAGWALVQADPLGNVVAA
eukprot:9397059-Pyramimonas_sp.AAC.1